ncbi:MAG: hypothetical protein Q7S08_02460 [bacterium]|nr:hypothetical protein [bacterium]
MNQALNTLKFTAVGFVLLHASDLSPIWLFEPYRKLVNAVVFSHPIGPVLFLGAIFVAFAVLLNHFKKSPSRA